MNVLEFNQHFHAYSITEKEILCLIHQNDLKNPIPFIIYHTLDSNDTSSYVRPQTINFPE